MTVLKLTTQQANNGPGLTDRLVDAEGFPRADIDVMQIRTLRNRFATLKTDLTTVSVEMERLMYIALAPPAADGSEPPRVAPLATLNPPPIAPSTTHSTAPVSSDASFSTTPVPTSAPAAASTSSGDGVADANGATNTNGVTGSQSQPPTPRRPAFALVDEVFPASPSATAGLLVNDRIVAFGEVSLAAFPSPREALGALPALLHHHEGQNVDVMVERGDEQNFTVEKVTLTPRRWNGQGLLGCHVVPMHVSQVDPNYAPEVATAVAERTRSTSSMV